MKPQTQDNTYLEFISLYFGESTETIKRLFNDISTCNLKLKDFAEYIKNNHLFSSIVDIYYIFYSWLLKKTKELIEYAILPSINQAKLPESQFFDSILAIKVEKIEYGEYGERYPTLIVPDIDSNRNITAMFEKHQFLKEIPLLLFFKKSLSLDPKIAEQIPSGIEQLI